jgi:hypothetical protein
MAAISTNAPPQTGLEKVCCFTPQASFVALFSGGLTGSPVSKTHSGECAMRSQTDDSAISATPVKRRLERPRVLKIGGEKAALRYNFKDSTSGHMLLKQTTFS